MKDFVNYNWFQSRNCSWRFKFEFQKENHGSILDLYYKNSINNRERARPILIEHHIKEQRLVENHSALGKNNQTAHTEDSSLTWLDSVMQFQLSTGTPVCQEILHTM